MFQTLCHLPKLEQPTFFGNMRKQIRFLRQAQDRPLRQTQDRPLGKLRTGFRQGWRAFRREDENGCCGWAVFHGANDREKAANGKGVCGKATAKSRCSGFWSRAASRATRFEQRDALSDTTMEAQRRRTYQSPTINQLISCLGATLWEAAWTACSHVFLAHGGRATAGWSRGFVSHS